MPSAVDILKGSNGLLPHLESVLAEDFSRFQIRGWSFDTGQGPAGYRLRSAETDQDAIAQPYSVAEGLVSTQEVTIGKVLTISGSTDVEAAGDAAVRFREALDVAIVTWSMNCSGQIEENIERITGTIVPDHDTNVPSRQGNKSWAFIVLRTFNIVYRLGA